MKFRHRRNNMPAGHTNRLRVQASPSDIHSWDSRVVKQSLSSCTDSEVSSGETTLWANTGCPDPGSRIDSTTRLRGLNKKWIISGAFGLWMWPFRVDCLSRRTSHHYTVLYFSFDRPIPISWQFYIINVYPNVHMTNECILESLVR